MTTEILGLILSTLFLFLPAYLANMAPLFLARMPVIKEWNWPLDGRRKLGSQRLLGDHKTFRGLFGGILGGMIGGLFMMLILSWVMRFDSGVMSFGWDEVGKGLLIGGWLGLGAIIGDALKSFFKRRLKIKPGDSWPFFDQIDFIVGAWVFSFIFYDPGQTWPMLLCALLITPPMHLLVNLLAFRIGWKEVWW